MVTPFFGEYTNKIDELKEQIKILNIENNIMWQILTKEQQCEYEKKLKEIKK
jgi:hypothetical protein